MQANTQPSRPQGEMDLVQLFLNIWATRTMVVGFIIAVLVLFLGYVGLNYILSNKTLRYSQVFDLGFEGLSKGTFPNGSPFLISEIISPTVLNRVYQQNDLESQGLALDEFRRSLTIQPYAPNYAFIRAKYDSFLSDKKLTPSEIADMQKQMLVELNAARSGSVLITMILPDQRGLTEDLANKILLDIASVWAKRAILEQGVLKPSIPIYSERIFDKQRFDSLDYLLGMDLLLNNIKQIRKNISSLKEEPNANTLIDEESGYTLVDLDKAIQDVADYDIRQIIDPIQELGITRNPEVVRLYYTRRLSDLQQQQKLWQERAKAIRNVLRGYSDGNSADGESQHAGQTNVPQLGDVFIDRLLEVSRQGSELEFRQKLTADALEHENKAIDLEQEINDIRRTLATMQEMRTSDQKLREIYIGVVEDKLPATLELLRNYTLVMVRLYEKQGRQNSGNISELVEAQGGTFSVSGVPMLTYRDIKILTLLIFFAIVFGVLFGLARNSSIFRR